jgi:phenylacetate-CoA ligase
MIHVLLLGLIGLQLGVVTLLVRASRFDHAPRKVRRARVRRALEALARHCLAHARHYDTGALRAVVDPAIGDDEFFARWRALPVLSKAELVTRFDDLATDPEITRQKVEAFDRDHAAGDASLITERGEYTVKKTSGTSGTIVYTVDTIGTQRRVTALLLMRALFRVLWRRGAVSLLIPGARQVRVLASRLRRGRRRRLGRTSMLVFVHRGNRSVYQGASGRSLPLFARLMASVDIVSHSESLSDVLERAARQDPELIYGLPSRIEWLARAQERGELDLAPLAVYVGGETLYPEILDQLRRAWPGAAIINTYGATETKPIAIACPECGELHICEDLVYLELLDEEGDEIAPGHTAARVLATSLWNATVPVLRYELADRIELLGDAGCRVRTRRIRVRGREPAFLWLREPSSDRWLPLNGRMLREKLVAAVGRDFMVRQPDPGRIEISLVVDRHDEGPAARYGETLAAEGERCVRETLAEHGWPDVPVEVDVQIFDPDGWNRVGGKLGAVTSDVKPPT